MTDASRVDGTLTHTADPDSTRATRPRWRRVARWVLVGIGVFVAIVVVLAAWPAATGDLGSDPDPTASYQDAVGRFAAYDDGAGVYPPCRSFLLDHGRRTDRAVVLFHGLTNCPEQFREFADELYAAGANVLVLRAPHHGLAGDDGTIGGVGNVGGLTAAELARYADTSVDIAAGLGDRVEVLGLSMGGVVAAWTAQTRADVDTAVVIAPAMSIPPVPSFLTTAFINLGSRLPNLSLPGEANLDHAYAGESTRALTHLFRMGRWVQDAADDTPPAAASIAVVLNPNDDQVDNDLVVGQLVEPWRELGGSVTVETLPEAQRLPHDVIDPDQPEGNVSLVYPLLLELLRTVR